MVLVRDFFFPSILCEVRLCHVVTKAKCSLKILLLDVGHSHYMQKFCAICWHRIQVKNVGPKDKARKNRMANSMRIIIFLSIVIVFCGFSLQILNGILSGDRNIHVERIGIRRSGKIKECQNLQMLNCDWGVRRGNKQH